MSEENNTQENPELVNTEANVENNSELQKATEQAEKFKNDFLYLRAEFENYKRHAIKERSELMKYAGERLARELLDVVDNFERALEIDVNSENFTDFKRGVDLTAQELKNLLNKNGITEVVSYGAPFDPVFHEALSAEENSTVQSGHVSRVFKKPYKYHDKILRIGQVVVAK